MQNTRNETIEKALSDAGDNLSDIQDLRNNKKNELNKIYQELKNKNLDGDDDIENLDIVANQLEKEITQLDNMEDDVVKQLEELASLDPSINYEEYSEDNEGGDELEELESEYDNYNSSSNNSSEMSNDDEVYDTNDLPNNEEKEESSESEYSNEIEELDSESEYTNNDDSESESESDSESEISEYGEEGIMQYENLIKQIINKYNSNITKLLNHYDKNKLQKNNVDELIDCYQKLKNLANTEISNINEEIPEGYDYSESFYKYVEDCFRDEERRVQQFISK
jgi:hypothetical protein